MSTAIVMIRTRQALDHGALHPGERIPEESWRSSVTTRSSRAETSSRCSHHPFVHAGFALEAQEGRFLAVASQDYHGRGGDVGHDHPGADGYLTAAASSRARNHQRRCCGLPADLGPCWRVRSNASLAVAVLPSRAIPVSGWREFLRRSRSDCCTADALPALRPRRRRVRQRPNASSPVPEVLRVSARSAAPKPPRSGKLEIRTTVR